MVSRSKSVTCCCAEKGSKRMRRQKDEMREWQVSGAFKVMSNDCRKRQI